MLKPLALALIAVYQRHLSPRKGFGCPLRLERGGSGCSGFGKRAIKRAGFWRGMALLSRRFDQCALAALARAQARAAGPLARQGGFVDCACDGPGHCDAPSCEAPSCADGPSGKRACSSLSWLDACPPDCSCGGKDRQQAALERKAARQRRREERRDKSARAPKQGGF